MKVSWTPVAQRHREDIWLHIAKDDPYAAAQMDDRFSNATLRLADYPDYGRIGSLPGTRETFPHRSYRLVYQVQPHRILIVALIHVARQWPPVRMDDA